MKKELSILFVALFALCVSTTLADVTLVAEDFDGNTVTGLTPSGNLSLATVADPAGGTNMVGSISFTGGGEWQSLVNGPNTALPANTTPGLDSLVFDYRLYIPSAANNGVANIGTGFGDSTSFNSLIRLNGTQPDAYPPSAQNPINGDFPLDQWVQITNGGVIPATDNTDATGATGVSGVYPILSIRNVGNTESGLLGYIDDINISVTENVPEPSSFSLIATLGLGLIALGRRRR